MKPTPIKSKNYGGIISVESISRSCIGCVGHVAPTCDELPDCRTEDNKALIFIKDTPEAMAAYIAQKLEGV
jgi:hypothetical protein